METRKVENLENNIRDQIHYESEQINRRYGWFGTIQGFLFATFGFVITHSVLQATVIPKLFCVLGIAIGILTNISIYASVISVIRLRNYFAKNGYNPNKRPDIFGYYPDKYTWTVFIAPESLIIITIIIAWVVLYFVI
jgi:hypothetical protein